MLKLLFKTELKLNKNIKLEMNKKADKVNPVFLVFMEIFIYPLDLEYNNLN